MLRRFLQIGELDDLGAAQALSDFDALGVEMHEHLPLLPREPTLRHNLTVYNAMYVALAEVLDVDLLTCDVKLGNAAGDRVNALVVR